MNCSCTIPKVWASSEGLLVYGHVRDVCLHPALVALLSSLWPPFNGIGGISKHSRLQKVGVWAWGDFYWVSFFWIRRGSYSNFLASTVVGGADIDWLEASSALISFCPCFPLFVS